MPVVWCIYDVACGAVGAAQLTDGHVGSEALQQPFHAAASEWLPSADPRAVRAVATGRGQQGATVNVRHSTNPLRLKELC